MMLISCPWCGPRSQEEFRCGGEARIVRPPEPGSVDDAAWSRYLFARSNPEGDACEQWHHLYGCGQWFHVVRNTRTHAILHVHAMDAEAPEALA